MPGAAARSAVASMAGVHVAAATWAAVRGCEEAGGLPAAALAAAAAVAAEPTCRPMLDAYLRGSERGVLASLASQSKAWEAVARIHPCGPWLGSMEPHVGCTCTARQPGNQRSRAHPSSSASSTASSMLSRSLRCWLRMVSATTPCAHDGGRQRAGGCRQ
jgi:hypothetical protein